MSILDQIDQALSSGTKSAFNKESPVGTKVRGPITNVDYRQVTDYTTQQPATFPSGDPKMQFLITIQAGPGDGKDDDGARTIYIPNWGKRKLALTEAIRDCGAEKGSEVLVPGVVFEAEYLGEQKADGGPSGSYTYKAYRYAFDRNASTTAAANALTGQAQAPAPAPAPTAPAQTAPDLSVVPNNVDPSLWNGMDDNQKRAYLAAVSG